MLVGFLILVFICSVASMLLGWRTWHRLRTISLGGLTLEQVSQLLRSETDRVHQFTDEGGRGLRQELENKLDVVAGRTSTEQRERLGEMKQAVETLKQGVESRLDQIRTENSAMLEKMRETVDEKLQSTLDTRLGASFNSMVEHLERVHTRIGEMQSIASDLGDLKKVFSNVRTRGTFGEAQVEVLLAQFLSPEQFIKNAQVKPSTQERVEFAVKFPGREVEGEVLLSIDAKFPLDDYERLVAASQRGDTEAVAESSRALEQRLKSFARTISEKYINPPCTMDFAVMFLPTEGLYAEALRSPGLFDTIQREYRVTMMGPINLCAFLTSLQMGFRSLSIEKRSSEIRELLGAVKTEFGKYGKSVDALAKHLNSAANSVEDLGRRTRVMVRKLSDVEKIPDGDSAKLLGLQDAAIADVEEEDEAGDPI